MAIERVPTRQRAKLDLQNFAVLVAQTLAWFGAIQAMHAPIGLPWKVAVLILFCLVMQGVFSMMHECFHHNGHRSVRTNWAFGVWASTMFGSSYTLIRVNHEGHHQRNRTPAELAEYILPGERPVRKVGLYYFAVLGGIWLASFIATLVLPLVPFRRVKGLAIRWTSMDGYNRAFAQFTARDWTLLRSEAALALFVWITCSWVFGWQWQTLLLMYACFAFSYSSLQWIYHLRTPLDRVEGAFDLRLPAPIRWLFLNFNYNLQHHRRPDAPWQALHARVDQRETQPLWWRWFGAFRPPEPYPTDPTSLSKVYF